MAPNGFATHYGAVNLDGFDEVDERKSSSSNKLLVAAGLVFVCTVGVFAMTMGHETAMQAVATTMNYGDMHPIPGDADTRGMDCKCATMCDAKLTPLPLINHEDPDHNDYVHYCDVDPSQSCPPGEENCVPCIGIDDRRYVKFDKDQECTDADGNIIMVDYTNPEDPRDTRQIGNCRAVCEYVLGRYDCWSYPCYNDGFCIDATDGYTCECRFGYAGKDCKLDINECDIEDPADVNLTPYRKEITLAHEPAKVCDENAFCENAKGAYSCECNAGWQGDGYRAPGLLWYDIPTWISRPDPSEEGYGTVYGFIPACIDVDACLENPCHNGATCLNMEGYVGQDDYDCECALGPLGAVGWVGHDCETDVDECLPEEPGHDCDPHATCVNQQGFFTCTCNVHWKSTDLNEIDRLGRMWGEEKAEPGCYDWPDCDSIPCQHGSTCTEGPDGCEVLDENQEVLMVDCYTCTCTYGWTGFDCEIDENECDGSENGDYIVLPDICHEESFCTNTPGSYECACNAGWTGDGITCIDADDCEFSPCAHGGTCYDCGTLCFTCDCVVGWRGTTCATDWNECIMGVHQCNDDATCANNPGSYDCRCDPGFTGTGFTQGFTAITTTYTVGATTFTDTVFHGCKDIDDCDPALYDGPELSPNGPCVMGTCEDVGPNAYVCACVDGYTDANCDMNVNECDPILGNNDCHRFAGCTDTTGSYTCQCNEGYTGNGYSSCLDISDCYGQCEHGFCSDLGVDDFKCTCDQGYMNRKCDYEINECTTYTHSCARHATCTDKVPHIDGVFYECACNKGWSGDGESHGSGCRDIDDCASNPCDFGDCTDEGASSYTCECQEGFTDFNCDFDVNECYLKTHNCHVDARCVNIPGGFFCRCLSGWEGDGLTCTDLDDCDPDPCDPTHGTCEDMGPNNYHCNCAPGWTGLECRDDENECTAGTHGCDPNASCTNTYGSHECTCNSDYYGCDGVGGSCTPCTVCPAGWKEQGVCQCSDLTCVNVDECVEEVDNCNDHATCVDNQGSFKCECDQNGEGDEWWGTGINDEAGCLACTVCYDGYHEIQPCTSTTDRICEINVAEGMYMLESEADDNRSCMALLQGEWYPSRINFGNGEDYCGFPGATPEAQKEALLGDGQAIFEFRSLGDNDQEKKRDGDMYTISFNDGDGSRCLFFGNEGKDIYPSLQNCNSFDLSDQDSCPWNNGAKGLDFCGFAKDGVTPLDALMQNLQAIWRVTPLKLNENKYILQSASKGHKSQDGLPIWECLAFEEQGAATNPSRYNWGNGDSWCGAGDWEGEGKVYGLLNNKQAVFILTFLQGLAA